ncbi:MAG TPA: septum formation initiator family protein [Stellaceae bacterium]|nr:septum formation initiator family protein [Stellaceae bacterium]
MSILREIRKRARRVIGPVLGISLVAYFAYHLVQGDRGLMAWVRLEQQVAEANTTLAGLEAQRATLEHRVDLLRPQHLDPDMLDERARRELDLIGPNETVIFLDRDR